MLPCPFTGISALAVIGSAFTPGWPREQVLSFRIYMCHARFETVRLSGRDFLGNFHELDWKFCAISVFLQNQHVVGQDGGTSLGTGTPGTIVVETA